MLRYSTVAKPVPAGFSEEGQSDQVTKWWYSLAGLERSIDRASTVLRESYGRSLLPRCPSILERR